MAKLVAVDGIALQAAPEEAFTENQQVALGWKPVRIFCSVTPGSSGVQVCAYVCAAENAASVDISDMLEYFTV